MRVYVLPGSLCVTVGLWHLAFDGRGARWWAPEGGPVRVVVGRA